MPKLPPHKIILSVFLLTRHKLCYKYTKRRATIGADTADHIHKMPPIDKLHVYKLCCSLRVRSRILETYYCVVLTLLNAIPNGVTCIYKILEVN